MLANWPKDALGLLVNWLNIVKAPKLLIVCKQCELSHTWTLCDIFTECTDCTDCTDCFGCTEWIDCTDLTDCTEQVELTYLLIY